MVDVKVITGSAQAYRLPIYVASDQGFFKKRNLNVSSVAVQSGTQASQFLAGGQAQFAIGQLVDSLNMVNADIGVKGIALMSNRVTNDLIAAKGVAKQGSLKTILTTQKIGVSSIGSGTWQFIQYVATLADVDSASLQLIPVGTAGPASLRSGRIGVFSYAGPSALELVNSGEAEWLVDGLDARNGVSSDYPKLKSFLTSPYMNNWAYTTTKYLESRPDVAAAFVAAIGDAIDWINSHSAADITALLGRTEGFGTAELVSLRQTVDKLIAAKAFPDSAVIPRDAFDNAMTYLSAAGQRFTAVAFESIVDNSFAEARRRAKK
jgi:NitT/TauT family transport system substrate-binding protein